jgi:hypothetical protein
MIMKKATTTAAPIMKGHMTAGFGYSGGFAAANAARAEAAAKTEAEAAAETEAAVPSHGNMHL